MAVQVVVAVNTDGRGNQETELRDLAPHIQRAVNGAVQSPGAVDAATLEVVARNDIAKFLYAIVRFLGEDSGLGRLLKRVADFFENLDPDGTKPWTDEEKLKMAFGFALGEMAMVPQAQLSLPGWINAECFQQLLASARGDLEDAATNLVNKVPVRLQEFLGCAFTGPQAQLSLPGMPQLDLSNIDIGKAIGCLLSAAGVYQRTNSVWQAVWSFGTCMLASGGIGGGAQVEHETVSRC